MPRRFLLLLPLALASCGGGDEPQVFEPMRFNYLPPIQLTVAGIDVQQRFIPAGVPPDVTSQDPEPPIQALSAMANDRLQAFGTSGRAIFAILDASLTREGDEVQGAMAVSLSIQDDSGAQLGFAEAKVQSRHSGAGGDIRSVLYEMTKAMMTEMNVEFEYQIRRNLKPFLTNGVAPDAPVQQAPLDQSPSGQYPSGQSPSDQSPPYPAPTDQSPTSLAPTNLAPTNLAPTYLAPADQGLVPSGVETAPKPQ